MQRDTVLAAVKAWPAEGGACVTDTAAAILDRGCARCHSATAGRDEETALSRTKKLDQERKKAKRRSTTSTVLDKIRCLTKYPIQGWAKSRGTHLILGTPRERFCPRC